MTPLAHPYAKYSILNQVVSQVSRQDLAVVKNKSRSFKTYLWIPNVYYLQSHLFQLFSYLTMKHILTKCYKYAVQRKLFQLKLNYNDILNNLALMAYLLSSSKMCNFTIYDRIIVYSY